MEKENVTTARSIGRQQQAVQISGNTFTYYIERSTYKLFGAKKENTNVPDFAQKKGNSVAEWKGVSWKFS